MRVTRIMPTTRPKMTDEEKTAAIRAAFARASAPREGTPKEGPLLADDTTVAVLNVLALVGWGFVLYTVLRYAIAGGGADAAALYGASLAGRVAVVVYMCEFACLFEVCATRGRR